MIGKMNKEIMAIVNLSMSLDSRGLHAAEKVAPRNLPEFALDAMVRPSCARLINQAQCSPDERAKFIYSGARSTFGSKRAAWLGTGNPVGARTWRQWRT